MFRRSNEAVIWFSNFTKKSFSTSTSLSFRNEPKPVYGNHPDCNLSSISSNLTMVSKLNCQSRFLGTHQSMFHNRNLVLSSQVRDFCTQVGQDGKDKNSSKSKFKTLIRDYGATAVVFHVTISLFSLGVCYLLVNSSLPMDKIFSYFGIDKRLGDHTSKATTSTNFVVAYAFHKSLAPIRLSITAASLPFLVRFLRSKNILKTPPKQS